MRSLLRSLSIRWRLALLSAGITFVVLCVFAVAIGQYTANRIRGDFRQEMRTAVVNLSQQLTITYRNQQPQIDPNIIQTYAASNSAVIRVVDPQGRLFVSTHNAPDFSKLGLQLGDSGEIKGYRVVTRLTRLYGPAGSGFSQLFYVQYGRKTAPIEATVAQVRLFLFLGVLLGSGIALGVALALSRRALAPIARLTATARDIEQTRDPNRRVPVPETDDEVAELARTLDGMLKGLEASRAEREVMFDRQRQFVADASHELRTPLTSVLANLELLADVLDGDRGEAVHSALRSTHRMRRLVADLLLLARADARRMAEHTPTDLGRIVVDAAAELGPVAEDHEVVIDAPATTVVGSRDELHRLAVNLIGNSLRHTPPGTRVSASLRPHDGTVELVVADDGPGVPPELREQIFDRFVRGGGDRGGSTGLGLAIVRAVAQAHGGDVRLESPPEGGARFVVTLPKADVPAPAPTPV